MQSMKVNENTIEALTKEIVKKARKKDQGALI